ncbi:FecR family protein [Pedobacter nototheniae]|uniref:FecR family protein n=1 Tax=Pedobacter nototheniae TaxID=2488994 RepID=UPI001038C9E0|nr:FecR family protein [Pedobacter nototheniae]
MNELEKYKDFEREFEAAWENSSSEPLNLLNNEKIKANILSGINNEDGTIKFAKSVIFKRKVIAYTSIAATILLCFLAGLYFASVPKIVPTNATVSYNEFKTGNKSKQFTLPDQTIVALKPNSTLKFSNNYLKNRFVSLIGNAFFMVTKNTLNPFVVDTKNAQVKVLGTSFNVNTITDDPNVLLNVEVISGIVKVTNKDNLNDAVILKKSDRAILYNHTLKLEKVLKKVAEEHPEKENVVFKEISFTTIVQELKRIYHVDFHIEGEASNVKYSGYFNQLNLNQALIKLGKTYHFHFIIKSNQVYITFY